MIKKNLALFGFLVTLAGGAFAQACGANNAPIPNAAIGTAAAPMAAACMCDGANERINLNGGQGAVIAVGVGGFIRTGFIYQCSTNSMVSANDLGANRFAIAGSSRRGNTIFSGSSATGTATTDATANACTGGSANDRLCTAANVAASLTRAEATVPAP